MKILLSLFIFCSVNSFAQTSQSNLRSFLINADSVIISNHKSLVVAEKPIGVPAEKGEDIVANGKPNYAIILKSYKLDQISIDSLATILTKEVDGNSNQMACFDPHHTVYIFKNGKLSYLDICLSCHRFSRSKDIETADHQLTDETWLELESFFANRGIENKFSFR